MVPPDPPDKCQSFFISLRHALSAGVNVRDAKAIDLSCPSLSTCDKPASKLYELASHAEEIGASGSNV